MAYKSKRIRRPIRKCAVGGEIDNQDRFGRGIAKVGQVTGLIGTIRSGVNQIAEPIRYNAEQIDPETGEYQDYNKAVRMGTIGAQLDPMRAMTDTFKDPNASTGEKWAAGINLLSPNPITSNLLSKKRYSRLEDEQKKQVYMQKMQNWGGASENPYTPIMPYGGRVQSETVELEKGEPYMLPDGSIDSISTNAPTHVQGGVPITLPIGTKVLGKKMAFKDKEFKVLGRKLEKYQKKYDKALDTNPTSIEANTAKRMLKNIQTDYNKLFQVQGEDVGGQQFAKGGAITTQRGISTPYYRPETSTTFFQQLERKGILKPGSNTLSPDEINNQIRMGYNIPEGFPLPYKVETSGKGIVQYYKDHGRFKGEFYNPENPEEVVDTYNESRNNFGKGGKVVRKGTTGLLTGSEYFKQNPNQLRDFQSLYGLEPDNIYGPKTETAWKQYGQDYQNNQLVPMTPKSGVINNPMTTQTVKPSITYPRNTTETNSNNNRVNNTMYTIGALAPTLYNIGQGLRKEDQLNPKDYMNPYNNEIRQTMRNRRYNVNPELEENRVNQATYYRQLREGAPNASTLYGGMQAGLVQKNRSDTSVLSRKQMVDSSYLGEQAQTDVGLGQDIARTKLGIKDINDRNTAARRNYMATGMSQIGQFAQIKQQENNMMIRDAQRLKLLPSLVQNFTLQPDGSWKFKQTGEVMTSEQVMNYIKGGN